jgi:hypothetical protein
MAAAMEIYGTFALLMIAVIGIIVIAALLSHLVRAIRRLFGATETEPSRRSGNQSRR